jgi:integrase
MTIRKLTTAFCRRPPACDQRAFYWDTELRGFGLAVTASRVEEPGGEPRPGSGSYIVQYRVAGVSKRLKIGDANVLSLDDARRIARKHLGAVADGRDPAADAKAKRLAAKRAREADKNTLKNVCERYLATEAVERRLRTADQRRADLKRLIYKALGEHTPIHEITRMDIREMLNHIAVTHGPVQSDRMLALVSTIMNWHARQDDDFISPVVRGMARTRAKDRARDRILTDDEIRALWRAAEAHPSPFNSLVQFLLLTSARRSEAAQMRWDELSSEGDWLLPSTKNKIKEDLIRPLSPGALAVLARLPKNGPHVFSGRRPMGGFSKFKRALDEASGVRGWVLHDLRRTASTLMTRAGVAPDHVERVLGHTVGGVRGVYNRHSYHAEKKRALESLAGLVERIVDPQPNVIALRGA